MRLVVDCSGLQRLPASDVRYDALASLVGEIVWTSTGDDLSFIIDGDGEGVRRVRRALAVHATPDRIHCWYGSRTGAPARVGALVREGLVLSLDPDMVLVPWPADLAPPVLSLELRPNLPQVVVATIDQLPKAFDCVGDTSPTQKPRLAFVSPIPPSRSGISYYSAELLPALARHYDIDVIVDRRSATPRGVRQVRDARWFDANAHLYDRIVYQFGNSHFHAYMFGLLDRHPGVVVLHDVFLTGVLAEMNGTRRHRAIWARELIEHHGYQAMIERAQSHVDAVMQYPSCGGVIAASTATIMHSRSAIDMAASWYGEDVKRRAVLILHLRDVSLLADREAARAALGFGKDDFVVCTFGNISASKLSDRLMDAWLASALAENARCKLVFAGRLVGGKVFDRAMVAKVKDALAGNVSITGWLDESAYQSHLAACDVAVQLRTTSRGESSGAALDCMGRGVPLVVNAHGSMAELPTDAVLMLDDDFADADLVAALESLRDDPARRALMASRELDHIRTHHAPERVAGLYRDAIENASAGSQAALERLPAKLGQAIGDDLSARDNAAVAAALSIRPPLRKRRLFVDVSAIARHDLRTGVERVTRKLLRDLVDAPPPGFLVEAIYAEAGGGFRHAHRFMDDMLSLGKSRLTDDAVEMHPGDIYFMPDLHHMRVIENAAAYKAMRDHGVSVNILVHDLLPVQFPEFFPPTAPDIHARWLRVVGQVDRAICVSETVATELESWFDENGVAAADRAEIHFSRHGADKLSSARTNYLDTDDEAMLLRLEKTPSFLMVGTVEPRKGHEQVLDAFEELWRDDGQQMLVIVGKAGWMVDGLIRRLKHHPERGKRLLWLAKAPDELLDRLYGSCSCLIAASYGEGFGLPLIEAALHGLPILARDIPVFREVASDHAAYFKAETGTELAKALRGWIEMAGRREAPQSRSMDYLTWAQSAERLKQILLDGLV